MVVSGFCGVWWGVSHDCRFAIPRDENGSSSVATGATREELAANCGFRSDGGRVSGAMRGIR